MKSEHTAESFVEEFGGKPTMRKESEMQKQRLLIQVERILVGKLEEFAKGEQTGMISIDVQVSNGKPTAINTATRENVRI